MAENVTTHRAAPQLRVLVVDDNVDGAEALCALLAAMGCATAIAFDGAQGLTTAAGFDPHVALIDLEMPDMNGCDMARHFRAGQVRSSARLVCLTGRGQPEDSRLCIEAGFDDFFTKPMLPETLAELVSVANAALGRR
ncbi:response regulator [Ideonella sp. YS5]|uniref:response regulator n=1 Tax=Ideonella sp. YS5 TaxID=3453714 RepID=UPI003EE9DFE4